MSTEAGGANPFDGVDLTAEGVISRMKEVSRVKTDAELAALLHTTRSNVAKWRKRNSIPYAETIRVALTSGVPLDYLLLGVRRFSQIAPIRNLDGELLRQVLKVALLPYGNIGKRNIEEFQKIAGAIADEVATRYNNLQIMIDVMMSESSLPEDKARNAAIMAAKGTFEYALLKVTDGASPDGPQKGPQSDRATTKGPQSR